MKNWIGERVLAVKHEPSMVRDRLGAIFGDGFESAFAVAVMLVASIAISAVMVASNGNMFAGAAVLAAIAILCLTLYRIQWGLFVFVGSVLVFDQFDIPGFNPITLKVGYFLNLKEIPYLPSIGAAVLNPLELQLLLIVFIWVGLLAIRKDLSLVPIPAWGAIVALYLGLIGFFIYGLRSGGEFLPALWEIRALFYFGAMYCLVPQIIRTKEDVHGFFTTFIEAISFKAFQAIYRFVRLGLTTGGLATLTNHEDPLFFLTLILFLFGLALFDAKTKQRWILLALLLPLVLAFYTGQRRAAYAAIVPMLAVFVTMLPSKQRWLLAKNGLPLLLVFILYGFVFWNSESRIAAPLKLIKTGLSNDKEEAGERYYSNLYRVFEKYNLAVTAQTSPIVGIGFGNKYLMPIKLANIPFPLRDYIPHDEVLWIMVKTGALGFFLFWFFMDAFAWHGGRTLVELGDPYLKAALVVGACALVGQITVSNFDLQLTYYRNMVYLGSLMGLMPAIHAMNKEKAHGSIG